jgi:hypothetical protein
LWQRAHLRVLFTIDFAYWTAFAVYQTTFALFGARRFGFDAAHTGYLLSVFGCLGVVVQGAMVGPIVARLGERRTLALGLLFAAVGWGGSAMTHSLPMFVAMLVPGAIGIGLCNATLSSLISLISKSAGPHEQGRVQGAAGGLESLGRTIGPVWGKWDLAEVWRGERLRISRDCARRSRRTHPCLPSAFEVGFHSGPLNRRNARNGRMVFGEKPMAPVPRVTPVWRRREQFELTRVRSIGQRAASSRSRRDTRSSSCSMTARTVSGWARSTPAFFNCSIG